jgi:hypothetical protein
VKQGVKSLFSFFNVLNTVNVTSFTEAFKLKSCWIDVIIDDAPALGEVSIGIMSFELFVVFHWFEDFTKIAQRNLTNLHSHFWHSWHTFKRKGFNESSKPLSLLVAETGLEPVTFGL